MTKHRLIVHHTPELNALWARCACGWHTDTLGMSTVRELKTIARLLRIAHRSHLRRVARPTPEGTRA